MHRLWKWLTWQRVPAAGMNIRDAAGESRFALAYAILYAGLACAVVFAIRRWPLRVFGVPDFRMDFWYWGVFKITCLFVIPFVWYTRRGYRFADLIPGDRLGSRDYIWTAIAYTAGFMLNFGGFPEIREFIATHAISGVGWRVPAAFLLAIVNAGIPEEFFFRGVLQLRLERYWGRLPAIFTTAVLFAAWHIPTRFAFSRGFEGSAGNLGSVLLNTGLPVFIVGLIVGWMWDRYRRLVPLIALHAGIDALPLTANIVNMVF